MQGACLTRTMFAVFLFLEVAAMQRKEKLVLVLFATASLLASTVTCAPAAEEWTYRDLARRYFAEGDGKPLSKFVGLSEEVKHVVALDYTVLVRKDGEERAVDPKEYQFALGDAIRIKIQPVNDTCIYIFHQGASGERSCLLPTERETPPLLKANVPFVLPADGYFEFVAPPGEEEIVVVATERPIAELAVLADVVFKKPGDALTPQEQAVKNTLKATVQKTLTSIRNHQSETMTFRGLPDRKEREKLVEKVQQANPTEVVVEEPPHGDSGGTLAMVVSTDSAPNLYVTIPLVSIPPSGPGSPSP
jgi:hypothetical protein